MTGRLRTIVGVATGTPDGGVAIVRVSGLDAQRIVGTLVGTLPRPRVLARRQLELGETREGPRSEDALVVVMPGPGSFTGEDVVELHVHAGTRNVAEIVARLLDEGATAAGPGEFTQRAFDHGKLGLEQAEGIAALVAARTNAAVDQARRLVAGELGRDVERLRDSIAAVRSEIEGNLDFADDGIERDLNGWMTRLTGFANEVQSWLRRFEAGRRARERARIVLAGRPNAGKSALFNALLARPRAIVSPLPGTTRDYVEAELELGRHVGLLVDTAGVREDAANHVEADGIGRTYEQVAGGDIVVWVESAETIVTDRGHGSLVGLATTCHVIEVESKRDLGVARPEWLGVSAVTGYGLEDLKQALLSWFEAGEEAPWIGLARHRDRAVEALEALRDAVRLLYEGGEPELVAFQLGVVERRLAEITGTTSLGPIGEDVLARIFAQFCIGK